jgi:hypothetical protein
MKQITQTLSVLAIVILSVFFSCKKKEKNMVEENKLYLSTTSVSSASSISGSPSCTLNSRQVICSNYLYSTTLPYSSYDLINGTDYDMYNYTSSYYVHVYFTTTTAPATGGYKVVQKFPPYDSPGTWQASVKIVQGSYNQAIGYGQSGVVYVVNTGSMVTATFCDVPLSIESNGNTYTATASAKVVN